MKTTAQAASFAMLVDNGSLRPEAVRAHRRLAGKLSKRIGRRVEAVSVLHSSAVPASKLGGRKAEILEPAVKRRMAAGVRQFVIVPLFIGASRALTDYIPERIAAMTAAGKDLKGRGKVKVRVARPLAVKGDDRLARILEREVRAKMTPRFLRGKKARVIVVDHGSPVKAVGAVRDRVTGQLRRRLGKAVAGVAASSMERRAGAEYDFNDPLLEKLLGTPPWNAGPVIVAQLFLLPGRHAGPRGDIAEICRRAEQENPGLSTVRTRLLGENEGIVTILADRFSRSAKI